MSKLTDKQVKTMQAAIASGHLSAEHKAQMEEKLAAHEAAAGSSAKKAPAKKATKKPSPSRHYESMEYAKYEGKVCDALEKMIDENRSDVQGIVMAKKEIVEEGMKKNLSPYFTAVKVNRAATRTKVKKGTAAKDDSINADLDECEELVKANRKANRKEPVKHTASTKLKNHIKGIANTCLEKIGDDAAKIKSLEKYLASVEIHIRVTYLGLKKEGLNEDTKDKLKEAADKAE